MKVKIKKTGEIVNVSDYATINLEYCDSYGNPVIVSLNDVEFIQEIPEDKPEDPEDKHWQNIRERAAIAALQGITSARFHGNSTDCTNFAINCANKLVDLLKEESELEESE